MKLAVAILLFLASAGAYLGAGSFSYLATDVPAAHLVLTLLCGFIFVLSLALAVIGATTPEGRLAGPASVGDLLGWSLLAVQAAFAAGRVANFQSSLEMMVATGSYAGSEVYVADDGTMVLEGEIGFATFPSLVLAHEQSGSSVLVLSSGGGLVDTAKSMGNFLRENAISTEVEQTCASACVIVALSGESLRVAPEARFGFHRGSAIASPDSELGRFLSRFATDDMVSELRRLGVPESTLARAETTPPTEMFFLSGEELYRAGLADDLLEPP